MNDRILAATLALSCVATPALAQGVDQLWRSCVMCHGQNGQGGGAGTRTLLDNEYRKGGTDLDLFNSIKNGIPEAGMVAFGKTLSDQQVWALVVKIRELQEAARRDKNAGPTPENIVNPQGTTGNISAPNMPEAKDGVYASVYHSYKIETVVSGGLDVPWAVDFLPDGRMLVTERPGRLRIHSTGVAGGTLGDPLEGLPKVRNQGQGGLMDVAVHPDYATNGWIYLAFSDPLEKDGKVLGMTKIVRGKVDGTKWTSQETIFEAKPEHYLNTDIHFGCRIVFSKAADGKRYTWFGIGERGMGNFAQDLSRPNGKIYRVFDDGKVPEDNPFVSEKNAYPAIWSFGHRNPQGLVFDLNGVLWDTEHGPRGGDELNHIDRARNYGWPLFTYGIDYSGAPLKTPFPDGKFADGGDDDIVMPSFVWLPSIGACGLDVVHPGAKGEAFPKWHGDLVAGGLSGTNVDRFRVREGKVVEREELVHAMGRVRDVVCGPDGSVYVVLNDPDKVVRLVPADK
jgi:glucose/arabinose dehydrogenase